MRNSYKILLNVLLFTLIFSESFAYADGFNAVTSSNGTVVWVTGLNGIIYRSGDGGRTFQDRSIGTTNYNSVFSNSLNIWIAGDNGTVLLSTNAGVSFTQYNIPGSANIISIYFITQDTGWAACSNGNIYKTVNMGLNWIQQTTSTSNSLNSIKFINSSSGAACGNNGTVLFTTNGGASWNLSFPGGNKNLLCLDMVSSTIFTSGADATVLKSTNLGVGWNVIDYKIPTKPDISGLSMVNVNTYYSSGVGGAIRRSTDGGNTFTFQNNPAWMDINKIYFYDSTRGWAISGNNNIVLRTTNAGANWYMPDGTTQTLSWDQKIFLLSYTSSGNVFYQSPWNKKEIFVTNSNKVYRSLDAGDTWSQIGSPTPYGTVSNSFLISTRDTNIFLMAIDSSDENHGKVFRSTDYGLTWSVSFAGGVRFADGTPFGRDPNHPDTVYYGLSVSSLYRTTNFGITWNSVNAWHFGDVCIIKVLENNPNIILVGSAVSTIASRVTRSSDYGLTWTVVDSNSDNTETPEVPDIITSLLNPGAIYSAQFYGQRGGVKKSTDQGLSWSFINIDNVAWGLDFAKDDPNAFVYGDGDSFLNNSSYISFDRGVHFTALPPINSPNFSVYYYNRNSLFLQMWDGFYKLHITTSTPIGIQPISSEVPKQFSLSQNYPNPFNPSTKIRFEIPSGKSVAQTFLSVYNALGQEITTLVNEQLKPGVYEVEWNASNYPSGVYFYKLQTEKYTETKKMVLIK